MFGVVAQFDEHFPIFVSFVNIFLEALSKKELLDLAYLEFFPHFREQILLSFNPNEFDQLLVLSLHCLFNLARNERGSFERMY